MNQGIYEELVTKLVKTKINALDKKSYQIKESDIDKEEASDLLSKHLSN